MSVIESVFSWLGRIISLCNKEVGTPFDRCKSALDEAVKDCKETFGDVVGKICHVTYLANVVCAILKPVDVICVSVDYFSNAVIANVHKSLFSNPF